MTSFAAPPTTELSIDATHRLIPSKYSESGTVLSRLTGDQAVLDDLMELDGATNERLLGEQGLLPGIGVYELVYGVRYAHIVNAAFTHASPTGGRFNSAARGAWYAAVDRETSVAEVVFHKLLQLEEIDWGDEEVATYDDFLADFTCSMHDLRRPSRPSRPSRHGGGAAVATGRFAAYLEAGPVPGCYAAPQRLAAELLEEQSNGILYPSVRRHGGECIACFRPALVYNVRRGARLELRLRGGRPFRKKDLRVVPVTE